MSSQTNKILTQCLHDNIEPLLEQRVCSIITTQFSDIDIQHYLKSRYTVILLEEAKTWNKFIEWITASFTHGMNIVSRPRLFVINIDLISRIPKIKKASKKTTKKKKSKKKSTIGVKKLIQVIQYYQDANVIFISEKPLKDYRMLIKPILIGDVINFNDASWVATTLMYSKNDKLRNQIIDNISYYDRIVTMSFNHLMKKNIDPKNVMSLMKSYVGLRYKCSNFIPSFILNMFQQENKKTVLYPKFYSDIFKHTDTIKLLKML